MSLCNFFTILQIESNMYFFNGEREILKNSIFRQNVTHFERQEKYITKYARAHNIYQSCILGGKIKCLEAHFSHREVK